MRKATQAAVRNMIEFLTSPKAQVNAHGVPSGLTKEEAYMLCSVAGDLRLHEVVGAFSVIRFSAIE